MQINVLARVAAGAVAFAAVAPAAADELVINGGFEGGNVGFSSSHFYGGTDPGPYSGGTPASGSYWLVANAASVCGCFANATGDGKFMAIDGATSGLPVWSQTVAVAMNSIYTLSYQAKQLGGSTPATIEASVNGVAVGTNLTPGGSFSSFSVTFNSGAASSLLLSLRDLETALFYNDYAIDNVSLVGPAAVGGVPEPASWALMLVGFAAVGAVRRRRGLTHAAVAA